MHLLISTSAVLLFLVDGNTQPPLNKFQNGTTSFRDVLERAGTSASLKHPQIREELHLTLKQREYFANFIEERHRDHLVELARDKNDELPNDMRTLQFALQELDYRVESDRLASAALTPTQRKRLTELTLQIIGPLALIDPEIQRRLNFSPEQQELVHTIYLNYLLNKTEIHRDMIGPLNEKLKKQNWKVSKDPQELAKFYESVTPHLDASYKKMGDQRAKVVAALIKLLTKGQRRKFDAMLGEALENLEDFTRPGTGVLPTQKQYDEAKALKKAAQPKEVPRESAPKATLPAKAAAKSL